MNERYGVFKMVSVAGCRFAGRGGPGHAQHIAQFVREGLEIGPLAATGLLPAGYEIIDVQAATMPSTRGKCRACLGLQGITAKGFDAQGERLRQWPKLLTRPLREIGHLCV